MAVKLSEIASDPSRRYKVNMDGLAGLPVFAAFGLSQLVGVVAIVIAFVSQSGRMRAGFGAASAVCAVLLLAAAVVSYVSALREVSLLPGDTSFERDRARDGLIFLLALAVLPAAGACAALWRAKRGS
jgi:hypothetical protein